MFKRVGGSVVEAVVLQSVPRSGQLQSERRDINSQVKHEDSQRRKPSKATVKV